MDIGCISECRRKNLIFPQPERVDCLRENFLGEVVLLDPRTTNDLSMKNSGLPRIAQQALA